MQTATHSLSAAVADGTITEEAAFCGLSPDDVQALARSAHRDARVLVRLRSRDAEGRMIMSVAAVAEWQPGQSLIADRMWDYGDIRDITAVTS